MRSPKLCYHTSRCFELLTRRGIKKRRNLRGIRLDVLTICFLYLLPGTMLLSTMLLQHWIGLYTLLYKCTSELQLSVQVSVTPPRSRAPSEARTPRARPASPEQAKSTGTRRACSSSTCACVLSVKTQAARTNATPRRWSLPSQA